MMRVTMLTVCGCLPFVVAKTLRADTQFDNLSLGTLTEGVDQAADTSTSGLNLPVGYTNRPAGVDDGLWTIVIPEGDLQVTLTFDADNGGTINPGGPLDLDLRVYDFPETEIGASISATSSVEIVELFNLPAGTYYAHADGFTDAGAYIISYEHTPPPPPFCEANSNAVLCADFAEGVPPDGWSIIDSTANGSWQSNTFWGDGNYTGGAGLSAAVNTEVIGEADVDTSLVSPLFVVPTGASLEFLQNSQSFTEEFDEFDVDINTGGAWINLLSQTGENHGTFFDVPGDAISIPLTGFGGQEAQVRFRHAANFEWYWQVDNIAVPVICGGGSDMNNSGGLDLTDYTLFADCHQGPNVTPADGNCRCGDDDGDEDIDLADVAALQRLFSPGL